MLPDEICLTPSSSAQNLHKTVVTRQKHAS